MSNPLLRDKNIIDVVKFKWLWIGISLLLIVPGIVAMIYSTMHYPTHSPLRLGIDFTGGTLVQYGFKKELQNDDVGIIRNDLKNIGINDSIIQIEKADNMLKGQNSSTLSKIQTKTDSTKSDNTNTASQKNLTGIKSVVSIRTRFLDNEKANNELAKLNASLKGSFGEYIPLQVSSVGPTLGSELFKNAMIALLLAFTAIVGYLTITFRFDYAIFALIALFHDALFVCGVFAILGLFFGTQIDSLFITAILTVVSFSVHDTIVVFDRIRENSRFLAKKMTFNEIVNASVNQTLARSINTSFTAFITLLALFFLGGSTTKDFILAMILGIAIGTYSSIFNASTLLAMWREKQDKNKPTRKRQAVASPA